MITPEMIEEWMQEARQRPESALLLLREIALRLNELDQRDEALQAENIALRNGKKVQEYESRIAFLEYELELLRSQARAAGPAPSTAAPGVLLYASTGHARRFSLAGVDAQSGELAHLPAANMPADLHMLPAAQDDELIFIFSTGRCTLLRMDQAPPLETGAPWWQANPLVEPRGRESLAAVAPVTRLALADSLVQVSRRGCLKRMPANLFRSVRDKGYIGSGVQSPSDQPLTLLLSEKESEIVLATQAGYLQRLHLADLPFSICEGLRLEKDDHLVAAWVSHASEFLLVTQVGKLIHRTLDWLEAAQSFKQHGQAAFSRQRYADGVRLVGSAPLVPGGWGVFLHQDGLLCAYPLERLAEAGAAPHPAEIVAFTSVVAGG